MLTVMGGAVCLARPTYKWWQIVVIVASWRKEWSLQTQPSSLGSSFMQICIIECKWFLSNGAHAHLFSATFLSFFVWLLWRGSMQWSRLKKAGRSWLPPSVGAMPGIASWSSSFSVATGQDLYVWGIGEGQHRLMCFQRPLFLLFSPKCFSATAYIIYSSHMYNLSAISTAVGIEKKLACSPPKCETEVLWL